MASSGPIKKINLPKLHGNKVIHTHALQITPNLVEPTATSSFSSYLISSSSPLFTLQIFLLHAHPLQTLLSKIFGTQHQSNPTQLDGSATQDGHVEGWGPVALAKALADCGRVRREWWNLASNMARGKNTSGAAGLGSRRGEVAWDFFSTADALSM